MTHAELSGERNVSSVSHFVLLGFSDLPNLQGFLFGLFSSIYLVILAGNGLIIIITRLDPALHRPMYFFLANFSALEICYVSITVPRILFNLWTQKRTISRLGCATQLCFFLMLGTTECFLLAVMSYDRYVAICNPLHYPLVMNPKKCAQLAVGSWLAAVPAQIGQTCQIFSLRFCDSDQINHFFCDIPPIFQLACGDTSANELSVYVVAMVAIAVPFILVLASYTRIISTILRLPTARGRAKAFPTCSSHLLVVLLFYGSAVVTYFRPKSSHMPGTDKLLSLFYTIVIPVFNPLIYTLRNRDVIAAVRKLLLKTYDMTHAELSGERNVSSVSHFILLGFSDLPNLQGCLFGVFSTIYLVILVGNGLIIIITRLDPTLHKPMYFFLANFSALEICYVSVTLPRILFNLWTQKRTISRLGCATQLCFFLILGSTECFLLAVMSYDRYVAICNPLHYPLVMNPKKCAQLAVGSWLAAVPAQIGQTCQIFSLRFCDSNQIKHFFCDIPPIFQLACGDTSANELSVYVVAMVAIAVPFILVLASYTKIISTILRLPTARGRAKAFSTCSSHLLVVTLFFGSGIITYFRPKSSHSPSTDKLLSLFYTIVTPVFNPLIYTLRNRDVIAAVRKLLLKT
ncbi:uncharacterized protein ACOB6Z_010542 [Ctenodactylus gundi]